MSVPLQSSNVPHPTLQEAMAQCPVCQQLVKALQLGLHVQACRGPAAPSSIGQLVAASSSSSSSAATSSTAHPISSPVHIAPKKSSSSSSSSRRAPARVSSDTPPGTPPDSPPRYAPVAAPAVSNGDDLLHPTNPWAQDIKKAQAAVARATQDSPVNNVDYSKLPSNSTMQAIAAQSSAPFNAAEVHEERLRELSGANNSKTKVEELLPCQKCLRPFPLKDVCFLDACGHSFCAMCLRKPILAAVAKNKVSTLHCPLPDGTCTQPLHQAELRTLLTSTEMEKYERASVRELIDGDDRFIDCVNPKCHNVIERVVAASSKTNKKEKDGDGKLLSAEAIKHKNLNRFRCRECHTEFCCQCKATPYHLGYTCEQFASYKEAPHCRFCDEQIKKPLKTKHAAFSNVCTNKECTAKKKRSCVKILKCGHACRGVRDEQACLECLVCEPAPDAAQTGDDFCPICYVEDLRSAPAIKLECGHIFHYECIRRKVAAGWPSSRITFTFLECPLCSRHVSHPSLAKLVAPHLELFATIRTKAVERLKVMKQTDVKELTDKKSEYYNKPSKYAMARFCYYPCYKCKEPYFGGEKACGAPVQAEDFNAKDLICGACSTGKNQSCKKHGKEFIEYKCKFCCKTACWFCWGNTHFCDDCHKIAPKIAKYPLDKLPKCNCGVPHPQNGTSEFCLGCSWCRMEGK